MSTTNKQIRCDFIEVLVKTKDFEVALFQFNHICMYIIKNFFCRINDRGLGAPSTIFERLKKIGGKGGGGAVRPNRILKNEIEPVGTHKS